MKIIIIFFILSIFLLSMISASEMIYLSRSEDRFNNVLREYGMCNYYENDCSFLEYSLIKEYQRRTLARKIYLSEREPFKVCTYTIDHGFAIEHCEYPNTIKLN